MTDITPDVARKKGWTMTQRESNISVPGKTLPEKNTESNRIRVIVALAPTRLPGIPNAILSKEEIHQCEIISWSIAVADFPQNARCSHLQGSNTCRVSETESVYYLMCWVAGSTADEEGRASRTWDGGHKRDVIQDAEMRSDERRIYSIQGHT
jgi:hypothetical protein